jgi:hypothetical protein
MGKYESFGAHPDWQYHALGAALEELSAIGVSRIQRRLFWLTSRWVERVRRLPGFRPLPCRVRRGHARRRESNRRDAGERFSRVVPFTGRDRPLAFLGRRWLESR